ncbi:(d)CMP kinase [Parachlamydia sp. AcF125]|uniref:(d)CMP kinase n=1 Tax=Parachlamydia sp. AcF125 TaxID=2795736 RepID=UPI001BCA492D|nr:(d)CMP kinase [Parachlamydia sp. AcF125]MBS4167425.1 Cytidylate kinase [Parachlamydia sp. AcF125]
MIITIDGPIATGKSTIAKTLAEEIGYIYFDTGAMYRCLTYAYLKEKVNLDQREELMAFLDRFQFDMKIRHRERFYYVGDEDVTDKIRGAEVTEAVSKVSANPEVREKLVNIQRTLAVGVNAVFEGRDMGTVVFPEARIKVYLVGDPETRARRRYEELRKKYPKDSEGLTLQKVLEDINERDRQDSTRAISPLRQPEGACVIDTSTLTIDEVVLKILEYKDSLRTHIPADAGQ